MAVLDTILVNPEIEENLGFIARVMMNFNSEKLIIINPKTDISEKSLRIAVHAKSVLENAKIIRKDSINVLTELKNDYDLLIGTTAKITNDYNLTRSVLEPGDFFKNYGFKKGAIIIGRESSGLTNDELMLCDIILTIPTSDRYKTMNISHALSILLYENYKNSNYSRVKKNMHSFNSLKRGILLEKINETLRNLNLEDSRIRTLNKTWKRVIGKTSITKREGTALMGFFAKVNFALEHPSGTESEIETKFSVNKEG